MIETILFIYLVIYIWLYLKTLQLADENDRLKRKLKKKYGNK